MFAVQASTVDEAILTTYTQWFTDGVEHDKKYGCFQAILHVVWINQEWVAVCCNLFVLKYDTTTSQK